MERILLRPSYSAFPRFQCPRCRKGAPGTTLGRKRTAPGRCSTCLPSCQSSSQVRSPMGWMWRKLPAQTLCPPVDKGTATSGRALIDMRELPFPHVTVTDQFGQARNTGSVGEAAIWLVAHWPMRSSDKHVSMLWLERSHVPPVGTPLLKPPKRPVSTLHTRSSAPSRLVNIGYLRLWNRDRLFAVRVRWMIDPSTP